MKPNRAIRIGCQLASAHLILILLSGPATSIAAAAVSPLVVKAIKDAEAKGYTFVGNHDEIVSRAKRERKLRVLCAISAATLKHLTAAFKTKYPFIDARAEEIRGTDVYLRMLQEMKSGLTKGQDVNLLSYDFYGEYLPYQKKFDILGMAETKVLQIPVQIVDPINRNIVAVSSGIQVVAYNKKQMAAESVPSVWEDFLKPEFREKKFVIDIRPKDVASLVPVWGLEKTVEFARKLAAQNPIWARGNTRVITSMLAGEHALHFGPNYDVILRAKEKDINNVLALKVIEPVPVRLNEAQSVLSSAENPHAALLWLEFLASPEGQKILDENGPYEGSAFVQGTVQEQAVSGKKLSVVDWNHFTKIQDYEKKIVEAYGFPRAEQ